MTSMLNFDQELFYTTYNRLLEEKSFRDVFYEFFIPLIQQMGVLWQTLTIEPFHERFFTVHIRQKILIHIERLQSRNPRPDTKTFVLFLPYNEIHDIGLLFINYELLSRGYHTIYLGESIPIDNLNALNTLYEDITYISFFTVKPELNKLDSYLKTIYNKLLKNNTNSFRVLGTRLKGYKPKKLLKQIEIFNSIESLVKDL